MKLLDKVARVIVSIVIITLLIGTVWFAINFGKVVIGCTRAKEACQVAIEKVDENYNATIEEIKEGKE